ncbi:exosortase/archaeosortase family protein [Roseisolibacter agri]|uniref:Exosortase n=1 Tax=Roseisolibacter agri TaxID=2014610 RepID=A0AA37Q5X2_9BACT|nr:exosortase/archaeosortase family protein [Roseisolibacter agri]GLC27169.1 exosortase [Roseisolibacter agri]
MTTASPPIQSTLLDRTRTWVSVETVLTAGLFAVLFARPLRLLALDWWNNPEAGHGLLLAPLALWFAWKEGLSAQATPNRLLGGLILLFGVAFRYLADLAAELFVMRGSILVSLLGLVVWYFGFRQALRWWLPFTLLGLSIPLPELILSRVALPLQFTASQIGASLLAWRDIPVLLTGNVIKIPGHELFVAEACSGLRSLTALLSLSVLLGAITLNKVASRVLLLAAAVPIAIMLNGVRVFLTGFLVYFVDPKLGEGFMNITEGWLIFVVAFLLLGGVAWAFGRAERWWHTRGLPPAPPAEYAEEYDDRTDPGAEAPDAIHPDEQAPAHG